MVAKALRWIRELRTAEGVTNCVAAKLISWILEDRHETLIVSALRDSTSSSSSNAILDKVSARESVRPLVLVRFSGCFYDGMVVEEV